MIRSTLVFRMIGRFVLSTLVGYYLLDSLAKLLNLRSLQTQVPHEFLDIYDADRYRRSQEYTRLNTWFDLVVSPIDLAALLIFWFLGGFEALDQYVRGFPSATRRQSACFTLGSSVPAEKL